MKTKVGVGGHDLFFYVTGGREQNKTSYPLGFNCWVSFAPVFAWCCSISRCRSQHVVSVKSSSLFHHSIYL